MLIHYWVLNYIYLFKYRYRRICSYFSYLDKSINHTFPWILLASDDSDSVRERKGRRRAHCAVARQTVGHPPCMYWPALPLPRLLVLWRRIWWNVERVVRNIRTRNHVVTSKAWFVIPLNFSVTNLLGIVDRFISIRPSTINPFTSSIVDKIWFILT